MKEIIFGTTNRAKLMHVQAVLDSLRIKVRSIKELVDNLPMVEEDGKNAQENARKKALVYCQLVGLPVLSMDNALYLDGLEDYEQPGVKTGRIPGFNDKPTDDKILKYYSDLLESKGGSMIGHWEFAFCLAWPNGKLKEIVVVFPNRFFTSKICSKRIAGYPLESLQIDSKTNKYVAEMTKEEQDLVWQDSIGSELKKLFNDFV